MLGSPIFGNPHIDVQFNVAESIRIITLATWAPKNEQKPDMADIGSWFWIWAFREVSRAVYGIGMLWASGFGDA